ncbi:MAG: hypothetical protein ABIQ31_18590 [Ferruginibacter sp.]
MSARKENKITTVKWDEDPKLGIVAIFFGNIGDNEKPGYWVEAHRTDFESDYVSEQEAEELYAYHLNNTQAFA